MKFSIATLFILATQQSPAQLIEKFNTAKNCQYMKAEERLMIYEVNHARNDPKSYVKYLEPLLAEAKNMMRVHGKGDSNYSLTYTTSSSNGTTVKKVDTTWHYTYEEELKAITTLIDDLNKMEPASILKPDKGIYKAAGLFADDQTKHHWQLMHTGSDGSSPWDRIKKHSTAMSFGNENIAGRYGGIITPRDIVLQLLIDSGIPGYGHRYNMLDPKWTHVACFTPGKQSGMYRWLQEFGQKK